MTQDEIRTYLENAIQFWRDQQLAGSPLAVYYIDALQQVLLTVFGQVVKFQDDLPTDVFGKGRKGAAK